MKITSIEIEAAFKRCVVGESVRGVARDLGVTEGALRFHFRKRTHPRIVRRLAYDLFNAQKALALLDDDGREAVARLTGRA